MVKLLHGRIIKPKRFSIPGEKESSNNSKDILLNEHEKRDNMMDTFNEQNRAEIRKMTHGFDYTLDEPFNAFVDLRNIEFNCLAYQRRRRESSRSSSSDADFQQSSTECCSLSNSSDSVEDDSSYCSELANRHYEQALQKGYIDSSVKKQKRRERKESYERGELFQRSVSSELSSHESTPKRRHRIKFELSPSKTSSPKRRLSLNVSNQPRLERMRKELQGVCVFKAHHDIDKVHELQKNFFTALKFSTNSSSEEKEKKPRRRRSMSVI